MKRLIAAVASAVMTLPFINISSASALNFSMGQSLNSESAVLVSLDTDMVLMEKNADKKQMPGPLVNIMTAVVCLENCYSIEDEVTMDSEIYSHLSDTEYPDDLRYADIIDGDVLTYTDMLYAMMLTSSVEAAETIAYNIGEKSVSKFVEMMNATADKIGLESTHFTNPTGMYDENQYTTARDMVKLTEYALKVPMFETIASTYTYKPTVPNTENHKSLDDWFWTHSNSMMDPESTYYYLGTRGLKTANLEKGGRNIVTTVSKDGNKYLAVLMNSPITDEDGNIYYGHLEDAVDVFKWAYNHFSYQVVLAESAELGELPVSIAEGNDYVLAKPREELTLLWPDSVDVSLISKDNIKWYKNTLQAPIKKNEPLGEVTLEYSGEALATVELVAVSDVERSVSKYNLFAISMFPKSSWFHKALVISLLLCGIYILMCVYSYVVFKNHSKPLKPIYAVPKVEKKKKKKDEK